ncbi:hypothetical protein BOW53_08340 [Solemya pervernicosa gill symbiont]|uniref:Type III pantothenate kinase n=2 Tax=Gammaproteobacteria incertae sedis TaxID=118884 RepID=A0A1T2L5D3_9GAMM|nr:type III pantothenate kinase [Candidatus Reidiella endopervernicosa]OOZ40250.1 hypothetical protein BOW53_08340 [Solemya pervernicosa gill symbiont]QKQ26055.1 type III pantothenate kinase [Candidatus Reidiella endopervernicosa]
MILLVDSGNSRLKWAPFNAYGEIEARVLIPDLDRFDAQLTAAWSVTDIPQRVLVSTVSSEKVNRTIQTVSKELWGIDAEFVRSTQSLFGVTNGYDTPEKLGVDRWMAMLAAWKDYERETIVVDCGTAVTIDCLNGAGQHLGGLITPGVQMMQEVLGKNTSGIELSSRGQVGQWARNTDDAIVSGSVQSVVALIERVVAQYKHELESEPVVVITGGDASCLLPYFRITIRHDHELVLKGLALLSTGIE